MWLDRLMADNPTAPDIRSIPLGFISENVHGQIRNARAILVEVDQLRKIAESIEDQKTRDAINECLQRLVAIVNNISSNVTSTTVGATVSVSGISIPSIVYKK
jgi:hypothetical protein